MPTVALGANVIQLRSVATCLVAVRGALQVPLSHNVPASNTHLRMGVYMCIRVMRNCTDFWSQHDEVLITSKLHYKTHREASPTSSSSAEDYSSSKHGLPVFGEVSRALRRAARSLMLLGEGAENGDDSCVLI